MKRLLTKLRRWLYLKRGLRYKLVRCHCLKWTGYTPGHYESIVMKVGWYQAEDPPTLPQYDYGFTPCHSCGGTTISKWRSGWYEKDNFFPVVQEVIQ